MLLVRAKSFHKKKKKEFAAIIVNPVAILQPAAVSPYRQRAGKCRHNRCFLALEIKQNLRILTVNPNLPILNLTQSFCRVYSNIHQVSIF